jgi:hypothetical protein
MAFLANQRAISLVLVAVLAVLAGLAAQLRPLLIYHLTLVPDLEARGLDSIDSPTFDRFASPPDAWPLLVSANFQLRAPILAMGVGDSCAMCGVKCRLDMGDGTLGVFARAPAESLSDAFDSFAPRSSDMSPWRSRARNWATLEAIAYRSLNPGLPESFRFRAQNSQGVVTVHSGPLGERFVIYSYGPRGTPTRVIGLTHIPRSTLQQILGSLAISDDQSVGSADNPGQLREASCSPWNEPASEARSTV